MIPVSCESCGNGHDYAAWLAGMRVQCKSCKSWLNIPRPEGVHLAAPAPTLSPPPPPAPVQSWRESVAEKKYGPTPSRPTGVSEAELTSRLNRLQAAAATPEEMVTDLVGKGCAQAFAARFVAQFLAGGVISDQELHAVMRQLSITGLEGMTADELRADLRRGGRFVIFQYCISLLVVTFLKPTGIRYMPATRSRFAAGVPYTLISLVLGWWGFPWGFIYTITAVTTNTVGGKDMTGQIVNALGWRNVRSSDG